MLNARCLQIIVEVERCARSFPCESSDRIVAGFTHLLPQPGIDRSTGESSCGYSGARSRNPEDDRVYAGE
jgi:hypothetical protein